MNFPGCANCLLHGWKQVEDLNTLQRCTKCKLIQYCGRECQAEHWKRIHKKQCKYFADPVKAQKFGHNEEACVICLQAANVGKAVLGRATNPNYGCIFKEKFPPLMYHPHPFPVTGQPRNTFEKVVIVMWQLLKKFELTQPEVIRNCQGKLVKVFAELKAIRLDIWKGRKISRQSECLGLKTNNPHSLSDLLDTIRGKVGSDESMDDLFHIIQLVDEMFLDVFLSENLQVLINPLADIPPDLHRIVSQAMINSGKYLAMANRVLDALTNQVVPYKDLLRIVCGGSLDRRCHWCSRKTTIARMGQFCGDGSGAGIFFNCLFMEIYICWSDNCNEKVRSMMQDYFRFGTAGLATMAERESAQCDFCMKLPPAKGGHRCSKCLTVMYCSTTCRDQDREIHQEFCKEDSEERKKKYGSSGRRKEARGVVDLMEKRMKKMALREMEEDSEVVQHVQGAHEAVSKIKDAKKKAKK